MTLTKHTHQRLRQRGIHPSLISVIIDHGTAAERAGNVLEYRLTRTLASLLIEERKVEIRAIEQAQNKAVLIAEDDTVVTIYHLYR